MINFYLYFEILTSPNIVYARIGARGINSLFLLLRSEE